MKKLLFYCLALVATLASAHAGTTAIAPSAAAAVASPLRPNSDVQADGDRKPAELLTFAGIRPGDKVADVMPGDGYFTRLFRQVVGPQGHVFAVVPQGLAASNPKRLDPIKALIAAPGYENVSLIVRPYEDIGVDTPLDAVWTSQNYHDIYGEVGPFAVSGMSGKDEAAKLDAAAFKALKPGGIYMVIDHAARSGSGAEDAKTLHRMDAATVIAQVTAAGFVLEDQSDVLANPQDAHDKVIFAPEIRGHTDKFVLKFRKPSSTNSLVLEGTWDMDAAYEVLADGKRTTNYGEHPKGLLMIDKYGRYSLQIFRPDRPKFASGVKITGTPEEYREAVLGSSTHTGRVSVDSENHKLVFLIDASSFPNWEGSRQVREYTFQGGTLSYSVPAGASGNGTVAYSVWRRAQP